MIVLIYMSFTGLDLQDKDEESEAESKYTDWFQCARWLLILATVFLVVGVGFFGSAAFTATIMKFPVAREYELCEGSLEWYQTPFSHDRDTGNVIWIGSMVLTFLVLSFAHFRQLRMSESPEYRHQITQELSESALRA
ncbi:unnamed protein product [Symbiodinium sp. CCMP2592]|nr:unnamed protein product [Symbiodinium sp. CCMP2592]